MSNYVIGLDYGTDSVRAILVATSNGEVISSAVYTYPRWQKRLYCEEQSNQFRQHPLDHLDGLEFTISAIVKESGIHNSQIKAICVDTTGSSPMPVDANGESLALSEEFAENPNAMMILWKDHSAIPEAEEITRLAKTWGGEDFTKYSGGIYSSEWFWAKILSIGRKDKEVKNAAVSWVEHCDYITRVLTGTSLRTMKRSRCAAGHKAMWHEDWDGLPPKEFLTLLDPQLAELRDNISSQTFTSVESAGTISQEWAIKLGLSENTVVAVGTIDAHAGAIGAGITENTLVKVIGTSTCDMLIASEKALGKHLVRGICGQVDGSIMPGYYGLEAGQAGFGDVLAWFSSFVLKPSLNIIQRSHCINEETKRILMDELQDSMLSNLSEEAEKLKGFSQDILALDWINGRRSPDADESLKGVLAELTMGTSAAQVFKGLVESLCFGSKRIIDRFEEEGLLIEEVIAIGGVANKSSYVMQTMADILGRTIKVTASTQAPALGAAMYAATASGLVNRLDEAIQGMGPGFDTTYTPNIQFESAYKIKYEQYKKLGELVEGMKL